MTEFFDFYHWVSLRVFKEYIFRQHNATRDIGNPPFYFHGIGRKCSRWQMTTDLIRLGAAWKGDKMPGTVTGFESAFSRFPRTLETVILPHKQEYCLKIDREESRFKFPSSDFFSVDSLWSLTDAIRSWFGRVSWFSTVSAGKRNVFVPWLVHTWSHSSIGVERSVVWFYAKFSSWI